MKWDKNEPDVQEICRETENEATWNIEVEPDGKDPVDIELVLCYTEIVGGDSYITKVKLDDFEWDAKTQLSTVKGIIPSSMEMEEFISCALQRTEEFKGEATAELAADLYSRIEDFSVKSDICL